MRMHDTPRSGNTAFVKALDHATPQNDVWRVTHWRDPVPHLPPVAFGYDHAVTEYFYNYDNTQGKVCKGGDDTTCCQQFETALCLVCCVSEHLSYMNQTLGVGQCQ